MVPHYAIPRVPHVLLLLSQKIGRSINSPFDIHQQRDVPEILQTVLDELVIASPDSMKKISVKLRYTFTCSACAVASVREENQSILPLPFDKLVQNAVDKFLGDEELVGENKRFCEICNRLTEAVKETDMLQCPDVLFVSMKRFKFVNGQREQIRIVCNVTVRFLCVQYVITKLVAYFSTTLFRKFAILVISVEATTGQTFLEMGRGFPAMMSR